MSKLFFLVFPFFYRKHLLCFVKWSASVVLLLIFCDVPPSFLFHTDIRDEEKHGMCDLCGSDLHLTDHLSTKERFQLDVFTPFKISILLAWKPLNEAKCTGMVDWIFTKNKSFIFCTLFASYRYIWWLYFLLSFLGLHAGGTWSCGSWICLRWSWLWRLNVWVNYKYSGVPKTPHQLNFLNLNFLECRLSSWTVYYTSNSQNPLHPNIICL